MVTQRDLNEEWAGRFLSDCAKLSRNGDDWSMCSPLRDEENPSFSVSLALGSFHDFATEERGSLRELAKRMGVEPPGRGQGAPARGNHRKSREAARLDDSLLIWERGEDFAPDNAYFTAKGLTGLLQSLGKPEIRQLKAGRPDIKLRSYVDAHGGRRIVRSWGDLVFPIKSARDGSFIGVEICEIGKFDGVYRKSAFGSKRCGMWLCGDRDSEDVVLCEGAATAMTVAGLFPDLAAVCCFGLSNMESVARALQKRFPGKEFFFAADVGAKSDEAYAKLSEDMRIASAIPPSEINGERLEDNTDWNDIYLKYGSDVAAEEFIAQAARGRKESAAQSGKRLRAASGAARRTRIETFSDSCGDAEFPGLDDAPAPAFLYDDEQCDSCVDCSDSCEDARFYGFDVPMGEKGAAAPVPVTALVPVPAWQAVQPARATAAEAEALESPRIIPEELYTESSRGVVTAVKPHDFARELLARYPIKSLDGRPHIYVGGVYRADVEIFDRICVDEIAGVHKDGDTTQKRKEIYNYLAIMSDKARESHPRYVAFANGVLDVLTGRAVPPRAIAGVRTPYGTLVDGKIVPEYDLVLRNRIPWDYAPGAKSALVDKFLDDISCGDRGIRALLEECAGVCLYRDNTPFKKAFLLTGERDNGKSTFLDLLSAALGEGNVSALSLAQLGERFSTASLAGRLANIGDDISTAYAPDMSVFKTLVSGDTTKGEEKYGKPFSFRSHAKLIFAANARPRMNDPGGAALERFVIIPFKAHFVRGSAGFDPQLRRRIVERPHVEYFLSLAVEALKRVLANGDFTRCAASEDEKRDYAVENNPVLEFIEEQGGSDGIVGKTTAQVYRAYADDFCPHNGYKPMAKSTFTKNVISALGLAVKKMRGADGKPLNSYTCTAAC